MIVFDYDDSSPKTLAQTQFQIPAPRDAHLNMLLSALGSLHSGRRPGRTIASLSHADAGHSQLKFLREVKHGTRKNHHYFFIHNRESLRFGSAWQENSCPI